MFHWLTGIYEYSNYAVVAFGIPLYVVLAWTYLFLFAFKALRDGRERFRKMGSFVASAWAAGLILTYDLIIDVFAVRMGLWRWIGIGPSEQFYGIYYFNYLWWFVSAFLLVYAYLELKAVFNPSLGHIPGLKPLTRTSHAFSGQASPECPQKLGFNPARPYGGWLKTMVLISGWSPGFKTHNFEIKGNAKRLICAVAANFLVLMVPALLFPEFLFGGNAGLPAGPGIPGDPDIFPSVFLAGAFFIKTVVYAVLLKLDSRYGAEFAVSSFAVNVSLVVATFMVADELPLLAFAAYSMFLYVLLLWKSVKATEATAVESRA